MNRVKRVLLVDDNQEVREALRLGLEYVGAEVVSAGSGEEALRIILGDRTFDLVVSDCRMSGMNGIETVGAIKKIDPSVRAVIVSGHVDVVEITEQDKTTAGVEQVLWKPVGLEMLAELVNG